MKKLVLLSLTAIFTMGFSYAQEPGMLPENAQNFINENFPGETVVDFEQFDQILNSQESDIMDFDDQEAYEVELSNGLNIEFGKNGKMTEMDSNGEGTIPAHALPDKIEAYLKVNYPNLEVVGYEIDADDQEVELDNGLDLEFDRDGRFIEED